jgi:hypothetical protein
MGLDTFAAYGPKHPKFVDDDSGNFIPNELFPTHNLCSGFFSGDSNSFRGKVYNDWIEWCTKNYYTLYREELSEDVVKDIYEYLFLNQTVSDYRKYTEDTGNPWSITYSDTQDLLKWFKVVVENNGIVINWW